MRLSIGALALVVVSEIKSGTSFVPKSSLSSFFVTTKSDVSSKLAVLAVPTSEESSTAEPVFGMETIATLSFRELQHACKARGLHSTGNTASLRGELRKWVLGDDSEGKVGAETKDLTQEDLCEIDIQYCDESDPDFDFNDLVSQILEKSSVGHWKSATRKLKRLKRVYATPERPIPADAYVETLRSCVDHRLHGARAAEPARKILEEMAEAGYSIPPDLANSAIQSCLGQGPNATRDGFGGVDTALAMMAAIEGSLGGFDLLTDASYCRIVEALTSCGDLDEAISLLRTMVVEHSFTPPLAIFAEVAKAAAMNDNKEIAEKTLSVLAFAKAAGYKLDNIASTEEGRSVLASGVIVAEKLNNLALGLRLLTAAAKAEGCAPDKGDDLVASSSSAAQRASVLIHRRAINKAIEDDNWRLPVKLLELMYARSLKPSPAVLRSVVTCCAKAEKSRKATALLLDWVKLAQRGETEIPPLNVFNTVVNACEICGEEELTLVVLEAMKKTHDIDGNIITMNIAMKRLAKLGNPRACEGLIIGMLNEKVEPTVVSYTTAIGACAASEPKDPAFAYQWLTRMRSRRVNPNIQTYNTALASCLDGKLESSILASKIAAELVEDAERELKQGIKGSAKLESVLPSTYTKVLARNTMKQLRENWRSGDIDIKVAKATIRPPLLKLVDFEVPAAGTPRKVKDEAPEDDETEETNTSRDEIELEYSAVQSMHRTAEI